MAGRAKALSLLLVGAAVGVKAQSRTTTPVLPPGAPGITWQPSDGETTIDPAQLCTDSWGWGSYSGCIWYGEITLKQTPLVGVRGNLTACYPGDDWSKQWFWCVWRYVTTGKHVVGKKTVPVKTKQWLTSLLPDRRLVLRYGNDLFVTKAIGLLPDSSRRLQRPVAAPTYVASREGPLTARAAPISSSSSNERAVSIGSLLTKSPRQPNRYEGAAKIEGTRLDLEGSRFLIVEGGELRLKQGTSVLETWPVYPKTIIVRFPDRTIEIHTLFAEFR